MQELGYNTRCDSSYRNSPVYPTRSYHFQNMQKSVQFSQTDKRIQEIKKKYDTPNRRERLSHLSGKKSEYFNKQNDNYGTAEFKTKGFHYTGTQDLNDSCLKESKALNISNRASMYEQSKPTLLTSNNNPHKFDSLYNQNVQNQQSGGHNRLYKNQNEQQFFKRVKQMKQSLLYSDTNIRNQNCLNTNINEIMGRGSMNNMSRDSRAKLSSYGSNQTVDRDRIDNIDKINQKIKGILECLNENEKGRSKYTDMNNRRSRVDSVTGQNLSINTNTINNNNDSNHSKLRELSQSSLKNVFTSSIIGKTTTSSNYMNSYNNRYDKSELLDKIEVNKNSNQKNQRVEKKEKIQKFAQDDDKWDKLSSKLQKYQMQNKLRMQKALQLSLTNKVQNDNENEKIKQVESKDRENKNIDRNIERNMNIDRQISNIDRQSTRIITKLQKKPQHQNQRRSYIEPMNPRDNSSTSVDYTALRSRSFLTPHMNKQNREHSLYHVRHLTSIQTSYQMRNGKKLDSEITRIQKKILQFQEQKKRLNINFKPFVYSNSKSSTNIGLKSATGFRYEFSEDKQNLDVTKNTYRFTPNQTNFNMERSTLIKNEIRDFDNKKQQNKQKQGESTFRDKYRQTFGIEINRKDSKFYYNFQDHDNNNLLRNMNQDRLNRHIEIKIQKSNASSVKTSKFISQNSSQVSERINSNEQSYAVEQQTKEQIQIKTSLVRANNKDQKQQQHHNNNINNNNKMIFNQNLKRQTDEGIQERRKKLQNVSEINTKKNVELKMFVTQLCKQVRLDEEFRNAKIWFEYNMNPKKEDEIRKYFPKKRFDELRQILKVRESENNPFFTAQDYETSFQRLAELYNNCEQHWKQNISTKFNRQTLQSQGFTEKQIDLDRKGHISLGDLVRFLNLQSGTFYRNRDIALIFIRICQSYQCESYTQLDFKYLLEAFSH